MTRASILLSLAVVIVVGCGGATGDRSIATSETPAAVSGKSDPSVPTSALPSATTPATHNVAPAPSSTTRAATASCPPDPPFKPDVLPDGFSPELLAGSGGQVTIGTDGVVVPIEPIDQAVRHYAGQAGRYIDVIGSDLPGYAPVHVETLEVLGTTGQLGEIEDGLKLAFALPCGTYTLLAYGVSAADFKLFIASLRFD